MAIDRRTFLAGSGLALFACPARQARGEEVFAAACREEEGSFAAIVCDTACGVVTRVPLPDRGHDIAVRPGTNECVVFARRPGLFAIAFAADGSRPPRAFGAAPGRHFFGHGAFAPDGRLLFSTEDDIAAGRGIIGVRDATDGYRQVGEFSSSGIGPHDLSLSRDGRTLVVANGGIDTGGGRVALDLDSMESSLAYVDAATGDILERHVLPPHLSKLSIRHLAAGHKDTLVFACQYEGPASDHPPLVGFHERGHAIALMEAPRHVYGSLRNYVGSIAANRSGELAVATSPRGSVALLIDVAGRRVIGERRLDDVCGVAPRHAGEGFLLTSGLGRVAKWDAPRGELEAARTETLAWDNHAVIVPAG